MRIILTLQKPYSIFDKTLFLKRKWIKYSGLLPKQTPPSLPFKCQSHKMVKHTQFVSKLTTYCLSVLEHFVGLALKGLNIFHEKFVRIFFFFHAGIQGGEANAWPQFFHGKICRTIESTCRFDLIYSTRQQI